jgi:hypothetical protein
VDRRTIILVDDIDAVGLREIGVDSGYILFEFRGEANIAMLRRGSEC